MRLSRAFIAAVLSLAVAACSAGKPDAEHAFQSSEEFSEWLEFYYLDPDPERIPAALVYFADEGGYERAESRMPTANFFAMIFRDDPALMRVAMDALERASDRAQAMLVRALWLTHSDGSAMLLRRLAPRWTGPEVKDVWTNINGREPREMLSGAVTEIPEIDMLWSAFFATGSDVPVKQVISALLYMSPREFHPYPLQEVGRAAAESLARFGLRHMAINRILANELYYANDALREEITKVNRDIAMAISRNGGTSAR